MQLAHGVLHELGLHRGSIYTMWSKESGDIEPLTSGLRAMFVSKFAHLNDGLYDFSRSVTPLARLLSRIEQLSIACSKAESLLNDEIIADFVGKHSSSCIRGDYACWF